jgi:hypothetical protein
MLVYKYRLKVLVEGSKERNSLRGGDYRESRDVDTAREEVCRFELQCYRTSEYDVIKKWMSA